MRFHSSRRPARWCRERAPAVESTHTAGADRPQPSLRLRWTACAEVRPGRNSAAMPPRYYLDEDVSHRIAPLVRAAGYDVLTTRDAGRNGTPDEEQLRFATV